MAQHIGIHRRRNPLSGDWVLVSPHRNNRPWKGAVEPATESALPAHDPTCPLCPGNTRANGECNPEYTETFVFTNDFAAVQPQPCSDDHGPSELMRSQDISGTCRVMCFAPNHNLSLPELSDAALEAVVRTWVEQARELEPNHEWVQIFENKGPIMGCSQPHPHGQIWAHNFIPSYVSREDSNQLEYFAQHGRALLMDYCEQELASGERTVVDNEDWLAVVPYWASWPFETLLLPKTSASRMSELSHRQAKNLASAVKELTIRYDNIFECSFPYSMGWHGAPNNTDNERAWLLHAHFYPPLLRSASVKKHMVGYEMMAESQRDLSPEAAAQILQKQSTTHYKAK
jgi:UDPglucose--hexose-1-phosphate uridylyltransferase